ncbi:MAG: HNH endonuclease [Lysobacterales bacterium]
MLLAKVGDTVYSYAHGRLGAIGVVIRAASPCPKPAEFGTVGDYWNNDGWLLQVAFTPLDQSVRPSEHIGLIAPLLPERWSPIQTNGHGNQGVYLTAISPVLGVLLGDLTGTAQPLEIRDEVVERASVPEDIQRIQSDATLVNTQRVQLIEARVGQGLFRVRVLMQEQVCKVTGVRDQRVLRASHIKPWRDANNDERLSADNGLLLSPHVDALFDQQLISFDNDGSMIVRKDLSGDVLRRWSIDPMQKVEPFRSAQVPFLASHRESLMARYLATGR